VGEGRIKSQKSGARSQYYTPEAQRAQRAKRKGQGKRIKEQGKDKEEIPNIKELQLTDLLY
jgi:hypothetical protein